MAEYISKAKQALVSSLSSGKMRRKHRLFVAEGAKCVADTLPVFQLRFMVATPAWIKENTGKIQDIQSIYEAGVVDMARMSALSTPPDVLAVYELPVRGVVPVPDSGKLTLLLDGVQDPGNLGTIIRTAHWFDIRDIYCSLDTVDLYNPKAIQATMGSIGHVNVYYCDLVELLSALPSGYPVYGTLLNGDSIYRASLGKLGAIVMGNEGNGISEEVRKFVTDPLTIPPGNTSDHPESLNVGIAAAVVISQFISRLPSG